MTGAATAAASPQTSNTRCISTHPRTPASPACLTPPPLTALRATAQDAAQTARPMTSSPALPPTGSWLAAGASGRRAGAGHLCQPAGQVARPVVDSAQASELALVRARLLCAYDGEGAPSRHPAAPLLCLSGNVHLSLPPCYPAPSMLNAGARTIASSATRPTLRGTASVVRTAMPCSPTGCARCAARAATAAPAKAATPTRCAAQPAGRAACRTGAACRARRVAASIVSRSMACPCHD